MIRNLRDLGGIVNSEGKKIKKNLLFRSAMLNAIDDQDLEWFKKNNITKVIDLRTKNETVNKPDIMIPGTEYVNWFLMDDDSTDDKHVNFKRIFAKMFAPGPEDEKLALMPDMTVIYRDMIRNPFSNRRFAEMIRGIMEYDKGAILFHCTSGKDRTGMTAAVLCCILGVDREAIYDDYLISRAHAEWEAAKMRDDFKERGASDRLADKLIELFTLDSRYLDAFFDQVEIDYGNVQNYLHTSIGLSDEQMQAFKDKMLE